MADIKKAIPMRSADMCSCHRIDGVRVGTIAFIDECGQVSVVIPESSQAPVTARLTSWAEAQLRQECGLVGREVLIAFEGNNAGLPIIVDTMHSLTDEIDEATTIIGEAEKPQDVTVDGKRIMFEAENEIVLKCGKASITLTSAGKVLLKGEYVLSHAIGTNRIKGGSISIN